MKSSSHAWLGTARSAGALALLVLSTALVPSLANADADPMAAPAGSMGVMGQGTSGSVDLGSGAATFAVPIEVPRARGLAQMDLALNYNSARGLGNVAYGWSLSVPAMSESV